MESSAKVQQISTKRIRLIRVIKEAFMSEGIMHVILGPVPIFSLSLGQNWKSYYLSNLCQFIIEHTKNGISKFNSNFYELILYLLNCIFIIKLHQLWIQKITKQEPRLHHPVLTTNADLPTKWSRISENRVPKMNIFLKIP